MASRYEVEVKISSARDLKNVNWRHGPNRPYAVVWVDPKNKCSTKVNEGGDTCPNWDETLVLPIPGQIDDYSTLYIDIVHAGSEDGTKPLIGSARLKLTEVLDDVGFNGRAQRSLQVKRPSGRPHGMVEVKVEIREPRYRAPDPYYAPPYGAGSRSRDYAAPPAYGNPYAAPPPPQDPYYASAPPAGYPYSGYNQPAPPVQYSQPSYGQQNYGQPSYGQQNYGQPVEEKKSKFGGMGTGLAVGAVAGVLGGIALVEGAEYVEDKIADDAAERVEENLDDEGDGGYDGDDY